jgi:hypothetical protein
MIGKKATKQLVGEYLAMTQPTITAAATIAKAKKKVYQQKM